MFTRTKILITSVCITIAFVCMSSTITSFDYKIHCLYIHKFSQLAQWPPDKKNKEIIIGMAGVSPITADLEKYVAAKNKTASIKVQVVKITSPQNMPVCDMLYISKEQAKNTDAYIQKVKSKPVLIITEIAGLIKKGPCINLIYEEGTSIKIQMNKSAFNTQRIKLTPELEKLANEIIE